MRRLSIFLLAVLSLHASAQQIHYRSDDPFVFCRYGQKDEDRCWWPTPDYTGSFMVSPLCNPYNYYGKQWSSDDWQSWGEYLAICPIAKQSGKWKGQGDGTKTPIIH
jgi:hypothetical protein